MDDYLLVATQLNILFAEVPHSEGRPFTLKEVSGATGISLGSLSHLRTGRILNPQLNTLRELCHFFNIPLRYFETQTEEQCYAIIAADRQEATAPEMSEIALRATQLSEKSQRDVLTIIKWVQAAEQQHQNGQGLPPLPGLEGYDNE